MLDIYLEIFFFCIDLFCNFVEILNTIKMKKAGQSIARIACRNRYSEYGVNSRHTNVIANL